MANNKKAKIERDSFEDVVEFQKNMYNPGYYVGTGKVPPTISAPGNAKLPAVINFLASALFLGAGLFLFFADDIFKGQSKPFEPTDGISLWNKIDETMEKLVSYESDGTATFVYYYSGNKFECTSVFKSVDDGKEGDEYFYLYDKTDVKCAEQSYEESRANLS